MMLAVGQTHLGTDVPRCLVSKSTWPFNPMKNEKCAVTLLDVGNAAIGNGTGARFAGLLHSQCRG